ncbi:hypothetical protein [Caldivirga maquilingensis]|uniref:Uncharacterized protein n=1 Tax=Caldivirga maquilingensis (strain ATCC 700844 / DSM 13496 / JCM 10307 / IC-167) TaxID=397948 RepID=A8M9L6_CALMQ|nr:hypothetical protein [Caldivirga maquilingensis]ABW00897.1 conserved hypothetical protein [Caldivirga maquilingensis IC-167]
MYPILLGINGIGYGSFTECELNALPRLMNIVDRGVVENKRPQYPDKSWWSILNMEPTNNTQSDPSAAPLVKLTRSTLINIPVANPTYGIYSINLDQGTSYREEVNKVVDAIINAAVKTPVIAAITAPDRFLHSNQLIKCDVYSAIDEAIGSLINSGVSSFILFSPYGEPTGPNEGEHEEYGIYIATISRPRHYDTVKLYEIGMLFRDLVDSALGM